METSKIYNKTVNSLIAMCLLYLCYHVDDLKPVNINDAIQHERMTLPINEDGSINVRLISANEIDVNIREITTSDVMNVNIKKVGGGRVRYNGPIRVKLDD